MTAASSVVRDRQVSTARLFDHKMQLKISELDKILWQKKFLVPYSETKFKRTCVFLFYQY